MKTVYNTHVRRLHGVRLAQDGAALERMLRQCRGRSVVLRVRQGAAGCSRVQQFTRSGALTMMI